MLSRADLSSAVTSFVGLGVKAAGVISVGCVSNGTAFLSEAHWDVLVSRVSHFPACWFGEPPSAARSGDESQCWVDVFELKCQGCLDSMQDPGTRVGLAIP